MNQWWQHHITDPGYGLAPSWQYALSWSSDMGWCYWCIWMIVIDTSLVQVIPWFLLATMALHELVMTTPFHWARIWHGTFLAPCPVTMQWYGLVLLMYLNDCGRYITGSGNSMVPPGCHGITWTNDDNTLSLTQDILGQRYGVVIIGSGNAMVRPGYHGITWTSDDNTISLTQDMAWHLLGTMPYHGAVIWAGVTDVFECLWLIHHCTYVY